MVTIRLAEPEDASAIVEFNLAMALETEQKELDKRILESGVHAVFQDPSHGFYMIAESEGAVIGSVLITPEWSDWRNGFFWWIQSLYVMPEWRRKGVFRSLYRIIAEMAKQSNQVRGLRLYVENNNTIARTAYEAQGMDPSIYTLYEQTLEELG